MMTEGSGRIVCCDGGDFSDFIFYHPRFCWTSVKIIGWGKGKLERRGVVGVAAISLGLCANWVERGRT